MKKITLSILAGLFFLLASSALAHQPRIVSGREIEISNPEVSQAFYAELQGESHIYEIRADKAFGLYLSLLVPDTQTARTDFSARVYRQENSAGENGPTGGEAVLIAELKGEEAEWKNFYEPFVGDRYLEGPEYKSSGEGEPLRGVPTEPGKYLIEVYDGDNQGKYVLAVGTREEFPVREALNIIYLLPRLKTDFFGKPVYTAYLNFTGLFMFVALLAAVFLVYALRKWLRKR